MAENTLAAIEFLREARMNPSRQELGKKLAELEAVSGVSEREIESEIFKLRCADSKEEACREWGYEVMAFTFCENYPDQKGGWGTYFGPKTAGQTKDGKMVEYPSLTQVDQETISYWQQRAESVSNPLLKARYAGLLWDLSKASIGVKPAYTTALMYCDALLKIADEKLHKHDVKIIQKLERALNVAISLNNKSLIEKAKHSILKYEKEVAEDSESGLWGLSFDCLVGNEKISLSEAEEAEIIDTLEARLRYFKDGGPWNCERAAERLARYYRKKGCESESMRVIKVLGNTFENAAGKVAPLVAVSWLERMYHICLQYNLKADAERLACKIRELGPKVRAGMKRISHKVKIPIQDFNSDIEKMVEGNVEEVMARIAAEYVPRCNKIEKQLRDASKEAPLISMATKLDIDHDGCVVSKVGPLEEDVDGNIIKEISSDMIRSSVYSGAVLDRMISKFDLKEDEVVDYLFLSPVFKTEQKSILLSAVHAYLQKDFVVAIHLLVPQIEAAIRNLVELSGGPILKPSREGGFQLKNLDDLLRAEEVNQTIGPKIARYFCVVLTDKRGWNVRNIVCHGILAHDRFSKEVADRLIHILIVIAQVRAKGPFARKTPGRRKHTPHGR